MSRLLPNSIAHRWRGSWQWAPVPAGDGPDTEEYAIKSGRCCTSIEGFSVHAGVFIPAHDRLRLEHLLRYASRPPMSNGRLSLLPDGRLLYRLKRRWSDGTTHIIYEPMELMERLAALVPPPAETFRPSIVPKDITTTAPPSPGCPAIIETSKRMKQNPNQSGAGDREIIPGLS